MGEAFGQGLEGVLGCLVGGSWGVLGIVLSGSWGSLGGPGRESWEGLGWVLGGGPGRRSFGEGLGGVLGGRSWIDLGRGSWGWSWVLGRSWEES